MPGRQKRCVRLRLCPGWACNWVEEIQQHETQLWNWLPTIKERKVRQEESLATSDSKKGSYPGVFQPKKIRSDGATPQPLWIHNVLGHGTIKRYHGWTETQVYKFCTIWNNIQMQSCYLCNTLWTDCKGQLFQFCSCPLFSTPVSRVVTVEFFAVIIAPKSLSTALSHPPDSSWGQMANCPENSLLLNFFYIWDQHGGFFPLYLHLSYWLSHHRQGQPPFLINLLPVCGCRAHGVRTQTLHPHVVDLKPLTGCVNFRGAF